MLKYPHIAGIQMLACILKFNEHETDNTYYHYILSSNYYCGC